MLVLSRKRNESIRIGPTIEVVVVEIRDGHVRLGVAAPREVTILRSELCDDPTELEPVGQVQNTSAA